ncbi:M12 family metallopeptidase [Methylobacterium aquaticum]|uniref:M12 family metallopeptidase n=1 Tax=Methylobacterium aquaticum TaxID=270351 RepID=UPI003D17794A
MKYVLIISVFVGISSAKAHGVDGINLGPPSNDPKSLVKTMKADKDPALPRIAEGVTNGFKLWSAGSVVSVCFFDSSSDVRRQFADIANTWLKNANLKFDFGAAPDFRSCDDGSQYNIRVSFNNTGNWSYVGTDAVRVDRSAPSLNVQSGNNSGQHVTSANQFKTVVLHEVGHALAMEHEHQSPAAKCDQEFNWPVIYRTFAQRYSWDKEKVDTNLRSLAKSPRIRTTEYDPNSIMHYHFDAWMFHRGVASKCYTAENTMLSALDLATITAIYPADRGGQTSLYREREKRVRSVIDELGLSSEQKAAIVERINEVAQTAAPGYAAVLVTGGDINQSRGCNSAIAGAQATGGSSISSQSNCN